MEERGPPSPYSEKDSFHLFIKGGGKGANDISTFQQFFCLFTFDVLRTRETGVMTIKLFFDATFRCKATA